MYIRDKTYLKIFFSNLLTAEKLYDILRLQSREREENDVLNTFSLTQFEPFLRRFAMYEQLTLNINDMFIIYNLLALKTANSIIKYDNTYLKV